MATGEAIGVASCASAGLPDACIEAVAKAPDADPASNDRRETPRRMEWEVVNDLSSFQVSFEDDSNGVQLRKQRFLGGFVASDRGACASRNLLTDGDFSLTMREARSVVSQVAFCFDSLQTLANIELR